VNTVADASVFVDAVAGDEVRRASAQRSLAGASLAAPQLLDVELAHALRRAVRRGDIGAATAHDGLRAVARLPSLERFPHLGLLDRVWELREAFTAYDACYVALAERLRATLLTCDRRLAASAAAYCEVAVVGS